MSTEISVLEKQLPIKAYEPKQIDTILETTFMYWLANLLSLKADKQEIVLNALPELKFHFHSLGLNEVKKAFEMYARGHMSLKPISNYFDVILIGQIFNEYRKMKPVIKKQLPAPIMKTEEKELIIYEGCLNCFEAWKQSGDVINGYAWVHDHLQDLYLLVFTDEQKLIMWNKAKENLTTNSKSLSYDSAKDVLRELQKKQSGIQIVEYKLIRLKSYFEKINAKGTHLKELI